MATAHTFKITKQQSRIYKSCCGHIAEFYTSKEFGLPNSDGWYITNADGSSVLIRYATLKDCKEEMTRIHVNNLLDYLIETEKVGA